MNVVEPTPLEGHGVRLEPLDGTVRDRVMYRVLANEWPDVRRHLH